MFVIGEESGLIKQLFLHKNLERTEFANKKHENTTLQSLIAS